MKRNTGLAFFSASVCSALLSVIGTAANAGDSGSTESRYASTDTRYSQTRYEVVQALSSKCRRNGVVWSGGVASRFSDRISPRPVRSRWDRDGENRIRCVDVDAFKQRRVSDQP
jgi:hypothetical protein